MKRILAVSFMLLLSIFSITGCGGGKSAGLSVADGSLALGKNPSALTEWRGYEGTHDLGDDGSIEYYLCNISKLDDCEHNTAGVLPENMTKHKKAKYYQLYLGTYIYMYYPYKGGYIEGNAILGNGSEKPVNYFVDIMYSDMENMVLQDNIGAVNYEGEVELLVDGYDFKARPNEIVIPSIIRVTKDAGTVAFTATTAVGEVTLGKASDSTYDYYKYKDTIIQVEIGEDISKFINFLP